MTAPVEPGPEDVNSRTVQLVKLLTELGPDVPEISRRLGQFKESVRYRYKEKVLNRGIAVAAAVDYERLGLKRLILVLDFNEEYKGYAQAIFTAMNELSYLISYSRALVGGQYVVNVSAPADSFQEVKDFYLALKDKGMFRSVEALEFDWVRTVPMKAEFYDFDTGRWDFQRWDPPTVDPDAAAYMPSNSSKFDYVDLLIIKELQMDANKSLKEISDKLDISYKKLAWHHTTHVRSKKLISGYIVNWMGTGYDYAIDKALHRKHRYFAVDLVVRNVSEYETVCLRQQVDRIPFLWGEAAGTNYFAQFAFPVDLVVEGLQFIGKVTAPLKDRVSLYTIDQTDATRFTVSYKQYDSGRKKWQFDKPSLLAKFDELIMQIRIGSR